jgi:hypothetical protein
MLGFTISGKKKPSRKRRSSGRIRPVIDGGEPLDKERMDWRLSIESLSDVNSREESRDFDAALAMAVDEIDKSQAFDTQSCISDYSSVIATPNVLLKPPRVLEKNPFIDSEITAAVNGIPRPKFVSAVLDRTSEAMGLPQPIRRSVSAREDKSSHAVRFTPPGRVGGSEQDTTGVVAGSEATRSPEIVPVGDAEVVSPNGDKENIRGAKQTSLPANSMKQKIQGFCASLKKADGVRTQRKIPGSPPRLTIKAILLNERKMEAQEAGHTELKSGDSPPVVIANGVAAVAGGYEFKHERPMRRAQSVYSEGTFKANLGLPEIDTFLFLFGILPTSLVFNFLAVWTA